MTIRAIEARVNILGVKIGRKLGDELDSSYGITLEKDNSTDPDNSYSQFIKRLDSNTVIIAHSFDGVKFEEDDRASGLEINNHPIFKKWVRWQ